MKSIHRLAAVALLFAAASRAEAHSPELSRITPRGGTRGTELDVTFRGKRLRDAQEIFLYRPGLKVLKVEPAKDDRSVKVRIKIAADAPLGEHPMRVRTATGITDLRTFFVGPFPTVAEKEPNSEFKSPQVIPLNSTVSGTVENEDVDYYAVEAKKGQRITAELEGVRLGVTLFDAYLSIMDAKRFDLAASDDTALLLQDPLASIIAPADGAYVIQVREASYGGNGNCLYRLHVGTFVRPLAVYPPGGKIGEEMDVRFIGDVKGDLERKIKLPDRRVNRHPVYVEDGGQTPTSANFIRVVEFPNVLEKEPNNRRGEATPTDLPLPVAFNGIIQEKGDEDWFRFKAKKGRRLYVKVFARDLRSPLDAVAYIYRKGGDRVVSNDDQGGPDSGMRFDPPADGEYELRIRDHLRNGGPSYVYRVEFYGIQPLAYTHIPSYDRAPRGQRRQWVVVPRGNRFVTWIRVQRFSFGGEMNLSFEGLPEGITVHAEPILSRLDRVPVVFEAAPDAPIAGNLAEVIARHADPKRKIEGRFRQKVDLVFGSPNNTVYYKTQVERLGVAVGEKVPFKIRIVEPKVPIVRNGSMSLKVVAEREKGFDAPIKLRLLWKPPGIGARSSVTMAKGKSEVTYPLSASGNAGTTTWKIAILGYADAGHGTAYVSTQPAKLTIAEPYVAMKIEMAATEQGKPAEIVCKLEQRKPFEGKAKVILHGLPPRVTAESRIRMVTKETAEVIFEVKTDPKTPKGQHKSLFCQVIVPENGELIYHNVGSGGVLRVDPPPPPKKEPKKPVAKKPAAKKKPEPKKPQVKRLTRLEKLRLEAQERAKAQQQK